ncbi:hypothetical protein TCE0_024r07581 [Talaromyces pinophilus]|uniref:Probable E3 ubiquitin ligase complex SCF subunit sconB n=1 Tax=Talaromyces pinophilus TaxID=128442 RepID=A0A6V8H8G1_TALPI|nr:hypothetical protein TCE0_024r07581 [Talaromyces pinophilus]
MAARYTPPRSLGQHRASLRDAAAGDHETNIPRSVPQSLTDMPSRMPAGGKDMMSSDNNTTSHNSHHPKPLPTPNKSASPLPSNLLPSAPASPPTPAPSPTPHQTVSNWQSSLGGGGGGGHEADDEDEDDSLLLKAQIYFSSMGSAQKQKFLVDILNLCDNQQLSFVSSFISPRLRKDPFLSFPNEICLRVLSFVDDPKTLARASQVSKRWHELINDDITWKHLCDKHAYVYRRPSDDDRDFVDPFHGGRRLSFMSSISNDYQQQPFQPWRRRKSTSSAADSVSSMSTDHPLESSWPPPSPTSNRKRRVQPSSYRTHFKKKYMVESAWNKGGHCTQKHVTPDQGVVTSLHLTHKYIVVALDNAKIHVYDTNGGNQKTLEGHVMGVWAMVPWDDLLVSGGCDREVRVWNMATGLQFDSTRIVSGGSDGRVKVWDLKTGQLLRELSTPAEAVWRVAFEEEKAVIMASRSGRTVMECDEARPGCRNCEIYGKTCPGYRPPIVLQDKSYASRKWRSSLVDAQQSQSQSKNEGSETSSDIGNEENGLALISKPRWLADASMDDRALCYFFDQYTTQRTPDSLPGALESIPLLYVLCRENEVAGSPSSCLRWAVEAAALTSYANESHNRHLALKARQRYGLALHGLKEALSMPVEKVQDSTLATILLLVIFEDINGERAQLESSHTAGLELVARLHTYRRLDGKYSRCLFNFAYTQLQIQILGLGAQPKLDLHFLVDLFDHSDPLQSLMGIVTKLSQFVLDVPALLSSGNPNYNIADFSLEDLANSLSRAQSLDEELSLWCRCVPDQWLPRVVYSTTGEALITCVSISAATLWNFYRCSRIIVQTVIDNIYTRMEALNESGFSTWHTADIIDITNPANTPIYSNHTSASASPSSSILSQSTPYEVVQNMIVDICRSMPYSLGDVDSSGVPFPQTHNENSNTRVKAIEGYELLWPFWHVLTSHFSTPKQRMQAREALFRLDAMGIKLASKMAGVVDLQSQQQQESPSFTYV